MDGPHAKTKIVIVGGGFGGIAAAKVLARTAVDIMLLDRSNHHLFQPLLYQVATAGLAPANIAHPIRNIFRKQKNVTVLLCDVIRISLSDMRVYTHVGTLSYDYLVLATGARHSYFGHPEWEQYAPGLKSIDDATEIRRRVLLAFEAAERATDAQVRAAHLTFVVIGAGPTGVELAGAIAELARFTIAGDFRRIDPRNARIILIEAGARVLPTFAAELSARSQRDLERLGVEVWLNTRVTDVTATTVVAGGNIIETTTKIWAAGVIGSEVAKTLDVPLDTAGRVMVNPDLSVPGYENVFVAGDLAAVKDEHGKLVPGLAPAAMQMGRHAGKNILRRMDAHATQPFIYFDKGNLATIGRASAVAQFGKVKLTGFFAWLLWAVVHIYFLIQFRARLIVVIEWIWAYFTFGRSSRLITHQDFAEHGESD